MMDLETKNKIKNMMHGYAPWRHNRLPDNLLPFDELFKDNSLELEVEAGCGMGTFLEARLKMRPDINYLGLETGRGRSKLCKRIAREKKFENAVVLNVDARIIVDRYLPADSVSIFHVYFLDPWPKKRHWRRRLLDKDFIAGVYRLLKKGGKLEMATDHEGYFEFIKQNNAKADLSWSQLTESINEKIFCPHIRTDFEKMWMKEERNLYYLEWVK